MKTSLLIVFALAAATSSTCSAAASRLHHFPLGRHRGLGADNDGDADDVDLDNLYQARGVQYADLKVGKYTCPFCRSLYL